MSRLSISTTWGHSPETSMADWLKQVRSLGIETIELDYTLSRGQLSELKDAVRHEGFRVSSVHNFCPMPDEQPSDRHASNIYRLSAQDERERLKAVEWTKKCIDTVIEFGAEAMVFHAGTVEWADDPTKKMIKLFKERKQGSPEFVRLKDELITYRDKHSSPYVNAVEKSLEEVVPYGKRSGVKIGLETRYYPVEIPNFREVEYFLDLFSDQGLVYWHDVGHAEINSRLGITPHLDFLTAYKDKMFGVHIHGMKDARDHLAPFDGDLDLDVLLPYLKDAVWLVLEPRSATADQLKAAVKRLETVL